MDARQSSEKIVSKRTSRRTVLKRSGQLGAAISGVAASGGLGSILASAQAPAMLQGSAPSGPVRFLYNGEPANEQERFAQFGSLYPDVQLEVVGIQAGSWAKFADAVTTRIAGGESFDVVSIATEGQRLFASRGLIEPIDDLLERDREELQEYYDNAHPNLVE